MMFLNVLVFVSKQAQLSLRKKLRLNVAALLGDFYVLSCDAPRLGGFSDFDLPCSVQTVVLEIKVFYGR